jgi:ketosteroid isomerase-like protein
MLDEKHFVDSAVVEAIDRQHERMRKAFEDGDAETIANDFYSPDAWVVGPENATWKGTARIHALYKGVVGVYRWTTRREKLIPTGNGSVLEYFVGAIEPVAGGETLVYKILFAWTGVGEKWMCATQFFAFGVDFAEQQEAA